MRGGAGLPETSPVSEGERKVGKMTKLEDHLEGIINIFHQYSVRLGHYDTLIKRELKQLITKELPNTLKVGCPSPGRRVHPLR